jgi:PAS domain S-box-containing protein
MYRDFPRTGRSDLKLSQKLACGVVILVGVPVFLLGHFLSRTSIDVIERQTVEHLLAANQLKQSEFDRWLTDNEERLTLLAQRPLVRDGLARLVEEHIASGSDPELLEAHEIEHLRLLEDHLLPYISEGGFERVSLLHPHSGVVLLSTDRFIEGMDRQSENYFVNGKTATTTQNPYYSTAQSKVMMTIATPVISRAGDLVAVLAGHLNLDEASIILSQGWDLTDSEDTYIVNQEGLFVTEPRFGEGFPLQRGAQSVGVLSALSGETGYGTYQDYRGIEVMGAYMWSPRRQLAVLTEINRAEAIGPISRVRNTLIWVSILVGLSAIALGMAIARGWVKPVETLVNAAEQLGQGNLDHRIAVTTRDEIGKLGHAFNAMADNLRQTTTSRDGLNREIEARTAAELKLNRTIDALEQSETMFRLLTDASPVGVFIIESKKLRYVNPAFEQTFGYTRDELIHKLGPLDITHPADHDTAREYIAKCFAGIEGLPPSSFIGVRKDGSHVSCEAMARPIEHNGAPALLGTILDVTLRRHAEAELRLKDTVFEASIAANSTSDVNGIITHANTAFLRCWRYDSEEEVVGLPLAHFIHNEAAAAAIVGALNEQGEWEGDFEAIRKDGSKFISNGHATVLRNESGELIGYQSANLDVTEQRHAEAELRQTKLITDSIIESIPGLFYQIDRDGRFVRWNGVFQKAIGYSNAEIAKMHTLDLFREQEKDAIANAMQKVFTHGRAEIVARIVTKWQEAIPHLFTGVLKTIDDVPYLLGVGTNITALLEAEEKFKTLVETTSECLWEIDEDLKYTYISPRIKDLLGVEPEGMLGRSPFETMTPESARHVRDELRTKIEDRAPFAGVENENVAADGHHIILETSAHPILGPTGKLLGYRGVNRDITDRKKAEQQLSRLLEELKRSNMELEQFAYIASHDLQEPLRMVASYTQLLERRYKDQLDDSAREFIGYAVDGASRMQRLISDLLTFSRVQTKGKPFERVDLNAVFKLAQENLKTAIDESAAIIVMSEQLPVVLADEGQMVSVFQNLLGNALKFHAATPPEIEVHVEDRGSEWEIAVSDNGIGISPEFHERIFVIFQRLHTRDEYPGTGIGLALCKRIIERHDGRIWVAPGKTTGSSFHLIMNKISEEAE